MWRPENWENTHEYLPKHMRDEYNELPEHRAYEAGADAMLEAIFKLAEESPTKTFTFDAHIINIYRGGITND